MKCFTPYLSEMPVFVSLNKVRYTSGYDTLPSVILKLVKLKNLRALAMLHLVEHSKENKNSIMYMELFFTEFI